MVTSESVRPGGGAKTPKRTLVSLFAVQEEQNEHLYISVVSRAIKLKADKGNSRLDGCEVRPSLFATNSCTLLSLPYSFGAVYHKDITDRPGTPWTRDCSKYFYPFTGLQLLVPENFTSVERGEGGTDEKLVVIQIWSPAVQYYAQVGPSNVFFASRPEMSDAGAGHAD